MLIPLLFFAAACDNQPATEPASPETGTDSTTTAAPQTAPEPDPEPEPTPARPKLPPVGVCAFISGEEVTEITGQDYNTALSAAAYPELSHCEYRKNRHAVALLIASGEGAVKRMEKAKAGPGKPVEGFEGGAVWDSFQGFFTAMSDGRCVEVTISPNHDDPPKHLDYARTLANMVLAKVPTPQE
jgi:hypothetical protein